MVSGPCGRNSELDAAVLPERIVSRGRVFGMTDGEQASALVEGYSDITPQAR